MDAEEYQQGRGLAGRRVRGVAEVIFEFHNASWEGNENVGEGSNLGIQAFFRVVVEVSETGVEETNF